jgi:uncharacterized protein DUF695
MIRASLFLLAAIMSVTTGARADGPSRFIAESNEDGVRVIWKVLNGRLPPSEEDTLRIAAVVDWKYDGSGFNGMPAPGVNERMLAFENALAEKVESPNTCLLVFSRTGNNLKQFVYYVRDSEEFLKRLNDALKDQPRYPIEITFHDDAGWKDLKSFLTKFEKAK